VVGMKMRAAEMIALGPFIVDCIEAGLGRIANYDGVLCAGGVDRTPRNLVGQLVDHGGWIEFGGGTDAQQAGESKQRHEGSPKPFVAFMVFSLPIRSAS